MRTVWHLNMCWIVELVKQLLRACVQIEFLPMHAPTVEEKEEPTLYAANLARNICASLDVPYMEHLSVADAREVFAAHYKNYGEKESAAGATSGGAVSSRAAASDLHTSLSGEH